MEGDVEKVLKDLGLMRKSLSMYGLVDCLDCLEDMKAVLPGRLISSNVGKDSMQDHSRQQCGQLHLLLLEFPHHPLQQLIAAGMLSYAQAELLG
jgi:hypothetical protein